MLNHVATWFSTLYQTGIGIQFILWLQCKCFTDTVLCLFIKNNADKFLKQRINIKFLMKSDKNAIQIYKMLQQVYGEGKMTVQILCGLSYFNKEGKTL
jgi:hypothetical protein